MNEQVLEDLANLRNLKPEGTAEDPTVPNIPCIYYHVTVDFVELFGCSWMASDCRACMQGKG